MRMKKFIALGLFALLFVAVQFMVPTNPVPVDNDVGICYSINADQNDISIYTMQSTTISPTLCHPNQDVLLSGVDKSEVYLWQNSPRTRSQSINDVRDLGGLTAGDTYSQDRVLSGHIT